MKQSYDVIVVGGDRPAAIVDPWGASVVEAPAAILIAPALAFTPWGL